MTIELTYSHLRTIPGHPATLVRLPRIRVAQIAMDHLAQGWSAEEICREHPYLTPAEVHAALTYYYDHPELVHAEIRAEWDEVSRGRAAAPVSPFAQKLRVKGLL